MENPINIWQTAGFIFTSVAGVLLHFLYEWSGRNKFVATFSATNESTWEHMKLLFFPLFIFAVVQSIFLEKYYDNFWCIKSIGILTGLILIPILFYTYQGITGVNADWFNIAIFFISAITVFLIEVCLFSKNNLNCTSVFPLILLCSTALLFVIFTFRPPALPLFESPV